ncbi:hypothetical protein EBZ37_14235, partial [bacterium]|nr:hypothetical protein [bacterium]
SKKNYVGGYTSYGSLSALHRQFSVFEKLKMALDREVGSYARTLGFQKPEPGLVLTSLWVNVMPKGCYHAFHSHPDSVVSGTFYVDVPRGASPLRIEDPRAPLFMASPSRKFQVDLFQPLASILTIFLDQSMTIALSFA